MAALAMLITHLGITNMQYATTNTVWRFPKNYETGIKSHVLMLASATFLTVFKILKEPKHTMNYF